MTPLAQLLEAALFSAARPLTVEELATLDQDATLADIRVALEQIREHYDFEQHGVELTELGGGYQILTRPIHAAAIEEIRGVSAGGVLRSLQERGLIEVTGRSEGLGRPLLYGTTPLFLELLGLPDLANLPRAAELSIALEPPRPETTGEDDAAAYVAADR